MIIDECINFLQITDCPLDVKPMIQFYIEEGYSQKQMQGLYQNTQTVQISLPEGLDRLVGEKRLGDLLKSNITKLTLKQTANIKK